MEDRLDLHRRSWADDNIPVYRNHCRGSGGERLRLGAAQMLSGMATHKARQSAYENLSEGHAGWPTRDSSAHMKTEWRPTVIEN